MKEFKDSNNFLILACVAVILLGLVSYFFSLGNPNRQESASSSGSMQYAQ